MDPSLFPKQASQIWEMLDDLAEQDPNAYKNFIQQNMEQGAELFTKPKSEACIRTEFHTAPNKSISKFLYVNIFTWKQIGEPKTDTSPIPMTCSDLKILSTGGTDHFVITVAVNPKVYSECCKDKTDLQQLFELVLTYVKDVRKLNIELEFSRLKSACKGDPAISSNWLYEIIYRKSIPEKYTTKEQDDISNKEMIDNLMKINLNNSENTKSTEKTLIEELPVENIAKEIPLYSSNIIKHENINLLKLCITLPKINTVSELDLHISADELYLRSEHYELSVKLEQQVDETSVAAKFNKSSHLLKVSANCLPFD
ncbi:PIH1 domain-containing protein 2 [Oopsacas minuta]|uniref:PIH1 domain-containing protein 2 n=1 Tax=Oopsacas minuta TaxID=111878 RepID=A0AAV7JQ14_9METZ|nr:PIH1 domain-containing protein 2 [Oopsacas minuta]